MKNTNKVLTYQHILLILAGCGINGQITNGAKTPSNFDCQGPAVRDMPPNNIKSTYWDYSQCLDDTFSVTNPGGISPPTICGKNQGRHSKLLKTNFDDKAWFIRSLK